MEKQGHGRIVLTRDDPRYPKPTRARRGELNCDRFTVVEGRLFRVSKVHGLWEVMEIETDDSMVAHDEIVTLIAFRLDDARKAIADHLIEWPTESREDHYKRWSAWVKAIDSKKI